jgi:hypothetical protein
MISEERDNPMQDVLDEALGDEPRAAELVRMKALLVQRRAGLSEDLERVSPEQRRKLERELAKLDEQIAVLGEEAEITKFVEDAVRVGIECEECKINF